MSDVAVSPDSTGPWPTLTVNERRVLGVLIEKQKTLGPDAYPMSLNALVTGSNQKTNRDPVLELDEDDVEEALMSCKARGLAAKVVGGRVERWRHLLYDAWMVDKVEMAILGELLLRGAQTEGELRTRASRMEPIDDLETLRKLLKRLVERNLVIYLTSEDRRGAMVTHGFYEEAELNRLRARAASAMASSTVIAPAAARPAVSTPPPTAATAPLPREDGRVQALETGFQAIQREVETGRQRLATLEQTVAELRQQLSATCEELLKLKTALGE